MNHPPERVRCCDCRYNHPRFYGYTKLREEGANTVAEDAWHGCRDFSPGRPPERDEARVSDGAGGQLKGTRQTRRPEYRRFL